MYLDVTVADKFCSSVLVTGRAGSLSTGLLCAEQKSPRASGIAEVSQLPSLAPASPSRHSTDGSQNGSSAKLPLRRSGCSSTAPGRDSGRALEGRARLLGARSDAGSHREADEHKLEVLLYPRYCGGQGGAGSVLPHNIGRRRVSGDCCPVRESQAVAHCLSAFQDGLPCRCRGGQCPFRRLPGRGS